MAKVRKRHWYIVFRLGQAEPYYFVSALSASSVYRNLVLHKKVYKVLPAKVWWLAKVMSGNPVRLTETTDLAPNGWLMLNDGIAYQVIILN